MAKWTIPETPDAEIHPKGTAARVAELEAEVMRLRLTFASDVSRALGTLQGISDTLPDRPYVKEAADRLSAAIDDALRGNTA